jgi:transposase
VVGRHRGGGLDPFRGYANGLLAQLGHATVVLDHFHAVRLANAAVDDVRRQVQQEMLGHRGRKGDPLYGIRRLLLVGAERLDERGRSRIAAGPAGDRFERHQGETAFGQPVGAIHRPR